MVTLSTRSLEVMGFRELVDKGSLIASFVCVIIYEARGISLPKGFAHAQEASVAGASYRIACSDRVNAGAQCLIGQDFTESESDWLEQVKATGPFIFVAVGPTEPIECEAGRMMRMPDGGIITYNIFPSFRESLKSLEARALPPVVTALALTLNKTGRSVVLRELTRTPTGCTRDGIKVRDVRVEVHAELSTVCALDETQVVEALATSVNLAPELHQRAAKYFALGLEEKDELKKFLFFFLSIEVETHAAFRRISHARMLRCRVLRTEINAPSPSAVELIARDIAKWSNLFDRFVWCATCVWPTLGDEDIRLFKDFKDARDAIAHGKTSHPPADFARKAGLLAQKILWIKDAGEG